MPFARTRLALATVFLAAALAGLAGPAAAQFTPEERTSLLTEQYLAAFNGEFARGNLSAWMSLWAEDATSASSREQWQGREQIKAVFQEMFDTWDLMSLEDEHSRLISGDSVAWQGTFAARHRKARKDVSVPVALFLTFDQEGKVARSRVYIDVQHLNDQLR